MTGIDYWYYNGTSFSTMQTSLPTSPVATETIYIGGGLRKSGSGTGPVGPGFPVVALTNTSGLYALVAPVGSSNVALDAVVMTSTTGGSSWGNATLVSASSGSPISGGIAWMQATFNSTTGNVFVTWEDMTGAAWVNKVVVNPSTGAVTVPWNAPIQVCSTSHFPSIAAYSVSGNEYVSVAYETGATFPASPACASTSGNTHVDTGVTYTVATDLVSPADGGAPSSFVGQTMLSSQTYKNCVGTYLAQEPPPATPQNLGGAGTNSPAPAIMFDPRSGEPYVAVSTVDPIPLGTYPYIYNQMITVYKASAQPSPSSFSLGTFSSVYSTGCTSSTSCPRDVFWHATYSDAGALQADGWYGDQAYPGLAVSYGTQWEYAVQWGDWGNGYTNPQTAPVPGTFAAVFPTALTAANAETATATSSSVAPIFPGYFPNANPANPPFLPVAGSLTSTTGGSYGGSGQFLGAGGTWFAQNERMGTMLANGFSAAMLYAAYGP